MRGVKANEDDSWSETLARYFSRDIAVALTFQMEGGRRASRREKGHSGLSKESRQIMISLSIIC